MGFLRFGPVLASGPSLRPGTGRVKKAFDVYFAGELLEGHELEQVKSAVGEMFGLSGPRLEALFSGVPVRVKKNLSAEKAGRFRKAFLELGALVQIVPAGQQPPDPADRPSRPQVRQAPSSPAAGGGLTLAPLEPLRPPPAPEPPRVDLSPLEVAPPDGGPLQPASPSPPPPGTGDLSLAPLDGTPHQPPRPAGGEIPDTSHLEAVPPDAGPAPAQPPSPPPPDTGGLRLEPLDPPPSDAS